MAEHQRTTIRKAMASMLAGMSVQGESVAVHSNRTRRFPEKDLPAAVIYDMGETAQVFDESPRRYRRQARFSIDLYVSDNDPQADPQADDMLNDMAEQAESKLFKDTTANGTAAELILQETSDVMIADDRDVIGMLTVTWQATYYTEAPEDESDVNDFTGADVDWDIPEGDDVDAEDTVNLL